MKSTVVDESLSTNATRVLFQRETILLLKGTTEWETYTKMRMQIYLIHFIHLHMQFICYSNQGVLINMDINKMGILHLHMQQIYGKDSVNLQHEREYLVKKMADLQNHRNFTLGHIKAGATPVICRIKNTMKTPKNIQSMRKAGRKLLNERGK